MFMLHSQVHGADHGEAQPAGSPLSFAIAHSNRGLGCLGLTPVENSRAALVVGPPYGANCWTSILTEQWDWTAPVQA